MTAPQPDREGIADGITRAQQRAEETRMNPTVSFEVAASITNQRVGEAVTIAENTGNPLARDQQALVAEVVTLAVLAGVDEYRIQETITHLCPPPFF